MQLAFSVHAEVIRTRAASTMTTARTVRGVNHQASFLGAKTAEVG